MTIANLDKRKDIYDWTNKEQKKKRPEKNPQKSNFFGITGTLHSTRKILVHQRYKGRSNVDSTENNRFTRSKKDVSVNISNWF
jgi:hypothetical protein